MLLGVTGGIACGKSSVMQILRRLGAITFSADEASRAILTVGGTVEQELRVTFGNEIFSPDGQLNRKRLGALVFEDTGAKQNLERITHPAILRLLWRQIEAAKEDFLPPNVIAVELPLLYEKKLDTWFEQILVVAASSSLQVTRLQARQGFTEEEAQLRIAAQLPLPQKVARANRVIWNEGSMQELEETVLSFWRSLQPEKTLRSLVQ